MDEGESRAALDQKLHAKGMMQQGTVLENSYATGAELRGIEEARRLEELGKRSDGSVAALIIILIAGFALFSNVGLMLTVVSVAALLCVAAIVSALTARFAGRIRPAPARGLSQRSLLRRCFFVSAVGALFYGLAFAMFRAISRNGTPTLAFYLAVLILLSALVLVHSLALKRHTGFRRALAIASVSQMLLFAIAVGVSYGLQSQLGITAFG
ncbi:MAG TPA: hypothetical protein VEW71_06745 [Allosphingosinicella sp.]|nr:hypothetical protein [Allosphingosinicella sp.]